MNFWKRRRREEELEKEIRAHLEMEAEEREADGLPSGEARLAAQRAFGNTARTKEDTRAVWRSPVWESIARDIRYGFRGARKSPGFTIAAVLSLAIGIGATTAVFSVLNAVLLRPLPVPAADELVLLQPQLRGGRFVLLNPLFEQLRESQTTLAGMFAISDEPFLKVELDGAAPVYMRGSLVSGNYFEALGVRVAAAGRLIMASDDEITADNCAAVISHAYWTTVHRADPGIVGRTVALRGKVCTITGVAPAGFRGHEAGYATEIWVPLRPLSDAKLLASRSMAFYSGVMGRLKPGRSVEEAEAELNTLYQGMQPEVQPSPRPNEPPTRRSDYRLGLAPGAQGLDTLSRQFAQPLRLVLAVVAVVLLIAAVNVANLLLARGAARRAEFATRTALGAGRGQLIRLLTIEGGLLAFLGGLLGAGLAYVATPALARVVSLPYRAALLDTSPDGRVLMVALGGTLLAALLVGVLPAFRLTSAGVQAGGRVTEGRSGQRFTRTLVAAQLALSLLLVTAAGLLLQTMVRVMSADTGFSTGNVVLMNIQDTEPAAKFGDVDGPEQKARRALLYGILEERLNGLPGVQAASLSWLGLFSTSYVGLNVHDVEQPEGRRFTLVDYVTPRYFETVGMRVLKGREFNANDVEGAPRVAIVNEAFVRERIEPGREAIGRRLVMPYANDLRPWTIAGVVRNAKYNNLKETKTEPMLWVPLAQAPFKVTSVSLRVQPGAEASAMQAARAALTAASPYLMVRTVNTLREQVDKSTMRERLLLQFASGFSGIALLLAAVGVYGILAYAVARRRREIGVRLALGAPRGAILRSVLREALMLVAAGAVAGVPLSLGAGYLLRSFLFGVDAYDAPTLIGAGLVLAGMALLAAYGPARRASGIDPVTALRYE